MFIVSSVSKLGTRSGNKTCSLVLRKLHTISEPCTSKAKSSRYDAYLATNSRWAVAITPANFIETSFIINPADYGNVSGAVDGWTSWRTLDGRN